jgi:PAS domain S-box-containing protein
MSKKSVTKTKKQLLLENAELQARLTESEEAIDAIRNGEVDAIIVSGAVGERVFTLTSAETPYRVVLEEMEEGAVTVSDEGTILYSNRRFAELVSTPLEQIIGSGFSRFIADDEKNKYHSLLNAAFKGRSKGEVVFFNDTGNAVHLHLSFCSLPEGMLGKVCIMVTDITELKKHQQQLELLVNERTADLEKANLQLRESNATKDKLFSIIAHDLRNPFTTLLGVSELLLENIGNYDMENLTRLLSHINSAAKSTYYLLENLLIWARAQNGQLSFNPKEHDLSVIINGVTASLNSLAVMKKISLTYSQTEEVVCCADENMVNAILRNLITNAIKFTSAGGKIEIQAHRLTHSAEITISDNGVGMSSETISQLFSMNSNLTLDGTAHEKGTGLGLILCNEFVEKHGGEIWVESELGKGSKFVFTLPYRGD